MTSESIRITLYPMQLVVKARAGTSPPWSQPDVALRVRPGDRPAWRRLQAAPVELDRLRAAASAARLPIDVVTAILAEWHLCHEVASHHYALLRQAARHDLDASRLAPNDDLRAWDQLLAGSGPTSTIDELPEVALPQRLAARLPMTPSLDHLGELADLDGAVQLERAAARNGMTLEVWVTRSLLDVTARP
ncbi:MAG TPA: hypothetical protein VF549_08350 [Solirubrobacteraceae bacterium]